MAQGDKWQIAVGLEIPNHSFRYPYPWNSTLYATISPAMNFLVNNTSPTADKIIKAGDIITMGPSTHSLNRGAVESKIIESVGTGDPCLIEVTEITEYYYNANNPIFALGHNLAGGAGIYGTQMPVAGINSNVGHDDNWSQKVSGTTTGDNSFAFINLDIPIASQIYKIGLWYKVGSVAITGNARMFFYDGSAYILTGNISVQSSFVELTTTGTTSATTGNSSVAFQLNNASVTNLYVDCFYVQHAKGSSGESNGYYEFSEYPDTGSLNITLLDTVKENRLLSGDLKCYDTSGFGERSKKHILKAKFSNVSQAFWDEIMLFWDWQKKGNLLNLRPFLDDLPPFLQGNMELDNITKNLWDLSKRSFDFTFKEA